MMQELKSRLDAQVVKVYVKNFCFFRAEWLLSFGMQVGRRFASSLISLL